MGISKVIIEEPLLNSNNVYTVQTLLRCPYKMSILGLQAMIIKYYSF